jgi:hypothetical protein
METFSVIYVYNRVQLQYCVERILNAYNFCHITLNSSVQNVNLKTIIELQI